MAYFSAANIATTGYPFLTIGSANLINTFASEDQKAKFLPPMQQGRFAGTMALTESGQGAVIQLTRSMAMDLMKHNIRVNAIAPGWFKTEINEDYFNSPEGEAYVKQMPARRLGKVEELVGPIIMLASEAGSFVNGAVIPVDGAIHARLI